MTILARIFLKEKVNFAKILSLLLTLVSIVLVTQPSYIFGPSESEQNSNTSFTDRLSLFVGTYKYRIFREAEELLYNVTLPAPNNGDQSSTTDDILGYVLMILAGCSGAVDTVIQKARLNDENPLVIAFWASIAMTVIPVILCLATELHSLTFPTDINSILLIVGNTVASALSIIVSIKGIAMTTAILITIAASMQIFFLTISQYTVLKNIEPGKGNWIEILGAFVVFIAAIIPPIWDVIQAKFSKCDCGANSEEKRPLLRSEKCEVRLGA